MGIFGTDRKWKISRRRDAMDWLEGDKMMKQWEEVSKEEEHVTLRRNEGRGLRVERV